MTIKQLLLLKRLVTPVLGIQVGLQLIYTKQNIKKMFCKEYTKNQTNTKNIKHAFLRWGEGNALLQCLQAL